MDSIETMEAYDLMFITDATASMGRFLNELKNALPQIFDLVKLTNIVERISVLAFRDYCDDNGLIEWSGWSNVQETNNLTSFVDNLFESGGGDWPEAVKTGLWEASKRVEKPTICILYVDAPPHHKYEGVNPGGNYIAEVKALGEINSQWINICELVRNHKMRFYPIFPHLVEPEYPFFVYLSKVTHGQCVEIGQSSVVRATIGILLNVAGVEFEYDKRCTNVRMAENVDFNEMFRENSKSTKHPAASLPVNIDSIEDIKLKIGNPIRNFQTSDEYKDLVFGVFERLLMPDRVMAFTYNTLFGKLWREICKQRKDPRRELLVEKLGNTVTTVSTAHQALLQSFIDESYDNTVEIENILLPYATDGPFYVIDHQNDLPRKVVMEIGRSCAPFAVQSVLKLLTGLRITRQLPNPESKLTYIPVNLSSNLKFKLIPHLISRGTMFSLRLSAIMASIAKISGSILRDDANTFLLDIRGKWIDLELPECNSIDFARLMMQIGIESLTQEEVDHFRVLLMVGSLIQSKGSQIEAEISYSSFKTKRPDYKNECKTCKQWRSTTLLLDETCAFCLLADGKNYLEPKTVAESWMCECRNCLVHYAVYDKDRLKCRAKCHFCRLGKDAPFITCHLCKNKFLHQQSLLMPNYICAVCTENKGRVSEKSNLTVEKYIRQNGAGFIGMELNATNFFDARNKLSKMSADERLKTVRNFADIVEDDLIGHSICVGKLRRQISKGHVVSFGELRKEVWNVKELQQQVLALFSKIEVSQCMICFEDFPFDKLGPICGLTKNGCTIEACRKCLNSWYNQLTPGHICQPAQLVCPYCKRIPKIKVVRQYNRRLCTLMNTQDVTAFDPSHIYAWCVKCYVVKQAMPRECGGEQLEITDFTCVDCTTICSTVAKECPKCKVLTEKAGGCNHIACQNVFADGNKCEAHWCWVCEVLSTDTEIYTHLSNAHGGYFSPEDIEEE